jgi:hypothetical protein
MPEMVELVDELERDAVLRAADDQSLSRTRHCSSGPVFVKEEVSGYLLQKLHLGTHYLSVFLQSPLYVALRKKPPPMKIISLLLERDQDPNEFSTSIPCLTPWCSFVRYCG